MYKPNRFFKEAFNRGRDAYLAGQPRTAGSFYSDIMVAMGFKEMWEVGWDTALFDEASNAGTAAPADAVCPYAHPETAADWVKGWRISHKLAVIRGNKKPD